MSEGTCLMTTLTLHVKGLCSERFEPDCTRLTSDIFLNLNCNVVNPGVSPPRVRFISVSNLVRIEQINSYQAVVMHELREGCGSTRYTYTQDIASCRE